MLAIHKPVGELQSLFCIFQTKDISVFSVLKLHNIDILLGLFAVAITHLV